jgi:hypothetical protein
MSSSQFFSKSARERKKILKEVIKESNIKLTPEQFYKLKQRAKLDNCTAVPDFDVASCCNEHDHAYLYKTGKMAADWKFFKCITSRGKTRPIHKKVWYFGLGLTYLAGVSVFGGLFYYDIID